MHCDFGLRIGIYSAPPHHQCVQFLQHTRLKGPLFIKIVLLLGNYLLIIIVFYNLRSLALIFFSTVKYSLRVLLEISDCQFLLNRGPYMEYFSEDIEDTDTYSHLLHNC